LQPFANLAGPALESLQSSGTLQGLGQNIGDILGGGALDPLIAERQRAADTSLGRAGLTRSGPAAQAAADIPAELAFQLEQLLQGRQTQLAGLGERGATNIANIRGTEGVNLANLFQQGGQAQASTLLGQSQAQSAAEGNQGQLLSSLFGFGASGGFGGGFGGFGGTPGINPQSFFSGNPSDIRLKTNIRKICEVGPLTLCEWDWHEGVAEIIDKPLMNTGFIAQDVKAHFPQFTGESHGFLTIDYDGLLEHLESSKWQH